MGDGAKGAAGKAGAWFGRWLVPMLVVFLVALGGAFLFVISDDAPEWWLKAFGVEEKSRVLEYLGIAMAGVLAAIGLVFAHRRAEAMTRAANAQAEAATQQAKANENQAKAVRQQAKANENTEKGQRQERLRDAIGHLGHDRESVRLGGAYELFHLAQDNEELRQTALDILCAHIRQTTGTEAYRETHRGKPSEEIQSLLTLLFVNKHNVFDDLRIDLQGSWLNGVYLPKARLRKANLWRAHLQKAYLPHVKLQGADLNSAHLRRANLVSAWLQGVDLNLAHLQGAELVGAHLQGAKLIDAELQGAYVAQAQLQGAILHGAQLQGACLDGAELQGAGLGGADMRGAVWTGRFEAHHFAENLRNGIDQASELYGVVFAGGLTRERVDGMAKGMPTPEQTEYLREILRGHIDRPTSNELPESCGAIIGTYTTEEVEAWIAEYEKAMKGVPEARE